MLEYRRRTRRHADEMSQRFFIIGGLDGRSGPKPSRRYHLLRSAGRRRQSLFPRGRRLRGTASPSTAGSGPRRRRPRIRISFSFGGPDTRASRRPDVRRTGPSRSARPAGASRRAWVSRPARTEGTQRDPGTALYQAALSELHDQIFLYR